MDEGAAQFLFDARQRNIPNATVYKEYQAKVESDNWSNRTYKTVMERLARVSVHELGQQDSAATTTSEVLTPARRDAWTPEEDDLLLSEIRMATATSKICGRN
jgi:hypothetical protein